MCDLYSGWQTIAYLGLVPPLTYERLESFHTGYPLLYGNAETQTSLTGKTMLILKLIYVTHA